jgi:hypothetical protein
MLPSTWLEVRLMVSPWHIAGEPTMEIVGGFGVGFTVRTSVAIESHPAAFTSVTAYVPAVA